MVENKDNKPEGNNTNTTFEAAIARLEEIVGGLRAAVRRLTSHFRFLKKEFRL